MHDQEHLKLSFSNNWSLTPIRPLDNAVIRRYFELGCEVKSLGRGHVKRIKDQVKIVKNYKGELS
ncbi:MAG: hypothetical protein V1766_14605 [Pseudomonadota bacterium]